MKSWHLLMEMVLIMVSISACKQKERPAKPYYSYDIESRIDSLGLNLYDVGTPVANYVHAVKTGNLIFLAGKGPKDSNGKNIVGRLGDDLNVDQGYAAARRIAVAHLSVLKQELGDLNKVKRIVKVKGMVRCTDDFTQHSSVINGYSDLMVEVFGNRGKHARAAVGMNALPGGICAEIECIVEI